MVLPLKRDGKAMKSLVLACQTIAPELERVVEELSFDSPILYMDGSLHDRPDALRNALQERLDHIANVDLVILAMGCCGGATAGLRSHGFSLVLPRVDDCLTLFLGSQDKRSAISGKAPTYLFTKGWLDSEHSILAEHARNTEKFGAKRADHILHVMYQHYEHIALIDTGIFAVGPQLSKLEEISELLSVKHVEVIEGTMGFIHRLLTGPYDERFVVKGPYEQVESTDFSALTQPFLTTT